MENISVSNFVNAFNPLVHQDEHARIVEAPASVPDARA